jgi:thiol-disulfide isomerase/thioredoxin
MLSRYPNWLILVVQILSLLGLYFVLRAWQYKGLIQGEAPPIAAQTLDGRYFSLNANHDSPLMLHFWATWCSICNLEHDSISGIAGDWPVMTVAMQSGGSDELNRYMAEHGLEWPVIVDQHGTLARRFGVKAVPTSFVIDANGDIRFSEIGYTTEIGLRARLWWAAVSTDLRY